MARSAMWAATVTSGVVVQWLAALTHMAAASPVVTCTITLTIVQTALPFDVSKINPELVEGLEFLFLFCGGSWSHHFLTNAA